MGLWTSLLNHAKTGLEHVYGGVNGLIRGSENYGGQDIANLMANIHGGQSKTMNPLRYTMAAIGQAEKDTTLGALGNAIIANGGNEAAVASVFRKMGRNDVFEMVNGKAQLKKDWAGMEHKYGFWDNMKLAHMDLKTGEYSTKKVLTSAGATYVGGMAAGRILSGGGIYRDKEGNTDIIGLPFI